MNWKEKCIAEEYGGDAERFEADWQRDVNYGRRDAVHWEDMLNGALILPDLEETTHDLVLRRLGYLPSKWILLPFEPFLRALIQSHREGQITDEVFAAQAEDHIKLIRNADMVINLCADYSPANYRTYEFYCLSFKEKVKSRLTRFLGYEPELKHSLVGELWLREMMSKDAFHLGYEQTMLDLKVLVLIKYREALLAQGQAIADALPLLGTGRAIQ